jgi:hypothetical protein
VTPRRRASDLEKPFLLGRTLNLLFTLVVTAISAGVWELWQGGVEAAEGRKVDEKVQAQLVAIEHQFDAIIRERAELLQMRDRETSSLALQIIDMRAEIRELRHDRESKR